MDDRLSELEWKYCQGACDLPVFWDRAAEKFAHLPRHLRILHLRYTADGRIALQVKTIAEQEGLSPTRVYQIIEYCLRALRHPLWSERIREKEEIHV